MTDALREKLVIAGRILEAEGQGDYILGHISLRLPDDPQRFLMKAAGLGLEEMTTENIITVDLEGKKIAGALPRHNEVFIHSEVLRARSDAQAVVHTHAPYAVAFSSLGRPLLPVGQRSAVFSDGLPIFDETTDLIVDAARGQAVARKLGTHGAMILQNHGIVTAGATIEEAVYFALSLEKACMMQLWAEAAGGPKAVGRPEEVKAKRGRMLRREAFENTFNYLARRTARP